MFQYLQYAGAGAQQPGAPSSGRSAFSLTPGYGGYSGGTSTGGTGGASGASSTDDGLPGSSGNPGNWIDNLADPNYVPYPLPQFDTYQYQMKTFGVQVQQTPGASAAAIQATPAPPTGAPEGTEAIALVKLPGAPVAPFALVPLQGVQQPQQQQQQGQGAQQPQQTMLVGAPQTVRAFVSNPAFPPAATTGGKQQHKTTTRKTSEQQLAELLGIRIRHVQSKSSGGQDVEIDSAPIKLTVPPNCNALEVTLSAIEPAPGGVEADTAELVDAGKQRIVDVAGGELDETALNPGDVVYLVVPWRAPAKAKIDAGKARRAVKVEFYSSIQNYATT
jgi:hypothetical protein